MLQFVSRFLQTGDVVRKRQYIRTMIVLTGCILFAAVSLVHVKTGQLSTKLQKVAALSAQEQVPDDTSDGDVLGTQIENDSPDAAANQINAPLLYDAWMYPDAPGAMQALRTAGNINALKAEFLHINDDGDLEQILQTESTPNGYSADNVAQIKKYSHAQFITVSGTMQGTEQAMRDPQTISGIVDMANKTGFGVELDWEEFGQWSPEYYQNYKTFVRQLASRLHATGHRLAIDGPPIYDASSQSWYQWKYEELAPLVDSVVMMVYDNQYDMGVGSSIAPQSWSLDCMEWLKRTAGSKAVVGVAAYGYSGDRNSGRIAVNTSNQIRRRAGSLHITRNADGELVASHAQSFYSFADQQTLDVRRAQVQKSGIHRLSVWSLGDNPWFKN